MSIKKRFIYVFNGLQIKQINDTSLLLSFICLLRQFYYNMSNWFILKVSVFVGYLFYRVTLIT